MFAPEIVWPSRREWREMRRVWPELPDAVGAIDATSQKINQQLNENQADYYIGHRHYHCMHTQIVIKFTIRHISSRFPKHFE